MQVADITCDFYADLAQYVEVLLTESRKGILPSSMFRITELATGSVKISNTEIGLMKSAEIVAVNDPLSDRSTAVAESRRSLGATEIDRQESARGQVDAPFV